MTRTRETQFYTVPEAARMLEVSPSTIWRWIEARKLPAYRIGPKKIRIKKECLDAMIRPAREGSKVVVVMDKERVVLQPPAQGELTRRQALAAQILAKRRERVIAPRTTADLVRKVRDQERQSYGLQ